MMLLSGREHKQNNSKFCVKTAVCVTAWVVTQHEKSRPEKTFVTFLPEECLRFSFFLDLIFKYVSTNRLCLAVNPFWIWVNKPLMLKC